MIEIRHLNYQFPDGATALDNITISFPADHIFAVLGESGSGKTTLLRCIGRFLQPQSGTIQIDHRDILSLDESELRRMLGIVFQKLFLFPHLTVLRNMTLAPEKALGQSRRDAEQSALQMLTRLGIGELAERYPSQISGGQAQRVAIARGLMLEPRYMLLDEPTSALDAKTIDEFAQWLRELQSDTQFIIVTHDLRFAESVATRGVAIAEGKVIAEGSMQEILSHWQSS